jgi:hypothetical protein
VDFALASIKSLNAIDKNGDLARPLMTFAICRVLNALAQLIIVFPRGLACEVKGESLTAFISLTQLCKL